MRNRRWVARLMVVASALALAGGIQWRIRDGERSRDAAREAALAAVAVERDAARQAALAEADAERQAALAEVDAEREAAREAALAATRDRAAGMAEARRDARNAAREARNAARSAARDAARDAYRRNGPERITRPFFAVVNAVIWGGGVLVVLVAFARGAARRRARERDAAARADAQLGEGAAPDFDPLRPRDEVPVSRR